MTRNAKTDLTFFTNEPGHSLLDRFISTLAGVEFFDVIAGYFRITGFHRLYKSLEQVEKIRILVGLSVDGKTHTLISRSGKQQKLDFESSGKTKEILQNSLTKEMDDSEDSFDTEIGARKFIEFLLSKKLEIKAYPTSNLHAKVYIGRFRENDRDFGRVITGSSNFSESGLTGNLEFNVELKNSADVIYALEKFEDLWKDAVDISEEYVDTIANKTWLNDKIAPYELYLKFLYEYLKEEINLDEEEIETYLPEGFKELKYQKQAVVSARKILEAYNGVFLADVVGLGKTYISAMLAQQLSGKILVICPPGLKDYWEDTFREFGVRGFKVESMGKLDGIIKRGADKYQYVFIDEAHRFRNEVTQGYEKLHEICFGKKIILVSATPLNNTIDDIYSQLKLFQIPKKSLIPGVLDLEKYFQSLKRKLAPYKKSDPEYAGILQEISNDVREKVLKYVMIRRTRSEVSAYFEQDLKAQNLSFPELDNPRRIIYKFDRETDRVFNETIELLKQFKYSRYTPLLYLKKGLSEFEKQSQRNVGGFMKGILVKRLESSFHAFRNTLKRFVDSYEKFIYMRSRGTVYISKKVDIYDYLESDNEHALIEILEKENISNYKTEEFRDEFIEHLNFDLNVLLEIQSLWKHIKDDPKLETFAADLKTNPYLRGNRLIVFTESKETGQYLYERLNKEFGDEVLFYCSGGGLYQGGGISVPAARDSIKENFDPNHSCRKNDVRILIATDVLAEGENLHRSNTIINYDLPWNPMRVLQRVGRVNRVGTEHKKICVFNFFPTAQSDEHLGLEANIKAKIQAFHDTLGEDAKYITEEEILSTHELFGDALFEKLNDKTSYEGEREADTTSKYLEILRDIRDKKPELFEKIKRLPKKARSSRKINRLETNRLITFFRKGNLKKFLLTGGDEPKELGFFEAVPFFECEPDIPKQNIPPDFYKLLELNKKQFEFLTSEEGVEQPSQKSGSNEGYVIKRLKAGEMRSYQGFTEKDEEYIKLVLRAFEQGIIPKMTSRTLRKKLEREMNPLNVLSILKTNIPDNILHIESDSKDTTPGKTEVILSEYLIAGD